MNRRAGSFWCSAAVYTLALVRHSALLGYLSGRHIMALLYASLPWAAAGTFVCAAGIAVKLRWASARLDWPALGSPARLSWLRSWFRCSPTI